MRFNRLFSGSSSRALALSAAAAAIADDEPEKPGEEEQPAKPTPAPTEPPAADPPAGEGEGDDGDDGEAGAPPAGDPPAGDPPAEQASLTAHDMNMHAAGRLEMADRITAVFASEDVVGREAVAAELLAADIPADRIVATLKKVPKGQAGSDMLNRLAASAGAAPALEPVSEPEPKSSGKDVWAKAATRLGFDKPKK